MQMNAQIDETPKQVSPIENLLNMPISAEKLTSAEQLRLLKGNFNFLVSNALGLIHAGYKDFSTGEFKLVSDIIYSYANRNKDSQSIYEDCPVDQALKKLQKKSDTPEYADH